MILPSGRDLFLSNQAWEVVNASQLPAEAIDDDIDRVKEGLSPSELYLECFQDAAEKGQGQQAYAWGQYVDAVCEVAKAELLAS